MRLLRDVPAGGERGTLTVHDFARMIEEGAFGPNERVDLIDGVLVSYAPPQGPQHGGTVARLTRLFTERFARRVLVWSQLPIILDEWTEVEPDVTLVIDHGHYYEDAKPRVADVYAVVEVAWSSLHGDAGRKRDLYARSGIGEYWVVDLTGRAVRVHRDPHDGRYERTSAVSGRDTVAFEAFPDVAFTVEELLG